MTTKVGFLYSPRNFSIAVIKAPQLLLDRFAMYLRCNRVASCMHLLFTFLMKKRVLFLTSVREAFPKHKFTAITWILESYWYWFHLVTALHSFCNIYFVFYHTTCFNKRFLTSRFYHLGGVLQCAKQRSEIAKIQLQTWVFVKEYFNKPCRTSDCWETSTTEKNLPAENKTVLKITLDTSHLCEQKGQWLSSLDL